MINEYYLGLTNPPQGGYSAPGSDYVPSEWQRKLSNEARAVQRALLVDPKSPTASNWRAVELRKLTEKSDLNSIMSSFDGRTGYLLNELLYNMTKYLQPQVTGGSTANQVEVHGRLTLPAYELMTWTITVGASDWTISGKGEATGPIISGRAHATLPGSEASVSFPTLQEGQFVLTWASKPYLTAVETAKELKRALGGEVDSLANQPSQLSVDDRRLLRSVILGRAEAPAKVVAGSLLLAGHTLAAPVED